MSKIVLVSGSNRTGNTEYILNRIHQSLDDSNLILLKEQNIEYCRGCLACHYQDKCIIPDDIPDITEKLIDSQLIIFGVPNYFDNVSGLFKNFIDRLHPLYKNGKLKDKKVIFIYVGGGNVEGTRIKLHQSIEGFLKYLHFDIQKEFSLKALNGNDMKSQEDNINEMIASIKEICEQLE